MAEVLTTALLVASVAINTFVVGRWAVQAAKRVWWNYLGSYYDAGYGDAEEYYFRVLIAYWITTYVIAQMYGEHELAGKVFPKALSRLGVKFNGRQRGELQRKGKKIAQEILRDVSRSRRPQTRGRSRPQTPARVPNDTPEPPDGWVPAWPPIPPRDGDWAV
jgi:hypothetical protein